MSAAKVLQSEVERALAELDSRFQGQVDIVALSNQTDFQKNSIGLCCDLDPEKVLDLAIDNGLTQIVQADNPHFASEINSSALMITDRDKFIDFPVAAILRPTNCTASAEKELCLINTNFNQAAQKTDLLKLFEDELEKVSRSGSFRTEVLGVADELITNAVFNAPFVTKQNSQAGVSRARQDIKMDDDKEAKFFAGADEKRLVVGCHDPYGSLNLMSLLGKVRDCYREGVASNINMGEGGAGIGSFLVYNACTSYYAAVKNGLATLVVCVIPLKMSGSKRSQVPKNMHYFQIEEEVTNGAI